MAKLVLIGDIVSSRRIKNRREIQTKLNKLFKKINNNNENVLSPFTITLGDEFQVVYSKADSLFGSIWQILLNVFPEKLRFSIGVGDITTKINQKQAIGMDGPAFYNARKGLDELKQNGHLLNISGDNKEELAVLKQVLFLISHLIYNWKKTRLNVLSLLNDGVSAYEISKKLRITDKAVYKNINAGALQIILKLTKEISKNINKQLMNK